MCDKAILENGGTLESVPGSYITQKCVVQLSILIILQYDLFLIAETCDKAVNKCFLPFIYISDRYKTQEMWDRAIFRDIFIIAYYPDNYKNQRMCGEAVDNCLEALKFVSYWFVTSKILEKLDTGLHTNDDILFYNKDFKKVTSISFQRHILGADFDKVELHNHNNFYEDDSDIIIHVRLLV